MPCIVVSHLSETEKRAFVLADNKQALNATWDEEKLLVVLDELKAVDLNFDVELTGFDPVEIDRLVFESRPDTGRDARDDRLPEIGDGPPVTRRGDVWLLGEHKILCADAREPRFYRQLLTGERAELVIADPPYNVPIQGHVGGSGKIRHREFEMAAGEMSAAEFTGFLRSVFEQLAHSRSTARSIFCLWIGGISARCWRPDMQSTASLKT